MLKKSTLLASILLVSACSSNTVTSNYVDDVVVNKIQKQDHVEVVGKQIIPVDLLELNLSLKMNILSVTANVDSTTEQSSSGTESTKSTVFFQIQYAEDNKTQNEKVSQYSVALVDGTDVALASDKATEKCDKTQCVVSQSFSFPVETALLEKSVDNGLYFSLLKASKDANLTLETMIPGRYLTALLAK
ncbi:hypothetical protein N8878_02110 [Psychromonas sp.]|nr:hypothetical protein [Psychromonas sp.]